MIPAAAEVAGAVLGAAPLTREGAAEAARRELSKPAYSRDDPSLTQRVLNFIGRWVATLFERAAEAGPGSRIGAVALVLLAAAALLAFRFRAGPLVRSATLPSGLLGSSLRTPAQYRADATAAAAAGDYAGALRETLRALARDVEVRGIVEPRAGRTADELVRDLTAALGTVDSRLPATVAAFDAVWYGGRPATRGDYDLAAAADGATTADLRRSRFGSLRPEADPVAAGAEQR